MSLVEEMKDAWELLCSRSQRHLKGSVLGPAAAGLYRPGVSTSLLTESQSFSVVGACKSVVSEV